MAAKKLHADQVDTSVDLVRRLVAGQFPQWADLPIRPVASGGTENAIYRLGDDMAVRLAYSPSRPGRLEQVEKLDRWLPVLAPQLPLAIPEPIATGEPTKEFPCPWPVVRWLEGEEATLDRLTDPVQAAKDLAAFVRALQRIDPTGGPPPGQHNFARGVPLADRDSYTREAIAKSEDLVDTAAVTEAWETDLQAPVWDKPPVWIHGDLDPGNMLASDGRLSGVIDWGALAIGDPCYELQPAWNLFQDESREAYRVALEFDDATWRRGRGFAISTAILALPYYLNTNPVIVKMARLIIEEVLADHARGG